MLMPPIATLGRVRGPLRSSCLFTFRGRDDGQPADSDVDGLARRNAPGCSQLRPVDPRAAHASEIAQPVRALLVGDLRVLARDGKIGELDGALRSATDRRAGLCHFERRSRAALALGPQREAPRSRDRRHGLIVQGFFGDPSFLGGPSFLARSWRLHGNGDHADGACRCLLGRWELLEERKPLGCLGFGGFGGGFSRYRRCRVLWCGGGRLLGSKRALILARSLWVPLTGAPPRSTTLRPGLTPNRRSRYAGWAIQGAPPQKVARPPEG